MKTFKLISMAIIAVIFTVNFAACSSSNDEEDMQESPKKWDCIFVFEEQRVKSGDTIYISDRIEKCNIKWFDANEETPHCNVNSYIDGPINGNYNSTWDNISFYCLKPGKCTLYVYDYDTEQEFNLCIIINEMSLETLKENIWINTPSNAHVDSYRTLDGTTHKGPFLELFTSKGFGTSGRITVVKFGCGKTNREASSWDFYWLNYGTDESYLGYDPHQHIYEGPNWVSFVFTYAGTQHEIRRYKNDDKCLWNGEWDKYHN